MKKRKFFKNFILLFLLFAVISATFQPTFAYVVTKTQTLTNTFEPLKSIVSDLIINKTVEHPFGEDYVIPGNVNFDFEVNLGSDYAGKTLDTTVGEKIADEAGIIIVNAKPGVPVGVQGIDENTKVIVTEIQEDNDGFNVKDGISSKEITVTDDSTATVDFINVYTPEKVQVVDVDVTGKKILVGRDWKDGDTFSFLLEQDDGTGNWIPLGTKSVTYSSDDKDFNRFNFNDIIQSIEFTQVGIYSFRISEVVGNMEHITYDEDIRYFSIVVGDKDMNGNLEIQDVTSSDNVTVTDGESPNEYNLNVTFRNQFLSPSTPEPEAIEVPVTVIKTVTNIGTENIGPENFEFLLENIGADERFILTSDEDGLSKFNIKFTSDDIGKTFNYRLSEVDDGREGVVYSDKVYNIKFAVTLGADNKLLVTMYCNGVIVKEINAEFENTYRSEPTVPDEPDKPTDPTATAPKPTEPSKPTDKPTDNQGNQGGSQDNTNPSQGKDVLLTGDTTNIVPMLVILVVSGLIWIALLFSKKSKKKT